MKAYTEAYMPVEIFYFIVFACDYAITVLAAPNVISYIFSFIGLSDFASMIPIISLIVYYPDIQLAEYSVYAFLGFLRFFRLLKLFKLLLYREVLWSSLHPYNSSVTIYVTETAFKISMSVISVLVFIFTATGFVSLLSFYAKNSFSEDLIFWFDSLYFVMVTITTLGYGDIVPVSSLAKALVVVILGTSYYTICNRYILYVY